MPENDKIIPKMEDMEHIIADMAVEIWRIRKVFERVILKLDAGEQNRYKSHFQWFIKRVEESLRQGGIKMVNIEGQPFDVGMAATPVNIEEFDANDTLVVDQMIEPIIMSKECLVRTGTMTLRKVN